MDSKFPCWDKLSVEYEQWHIDVAKNNGPPLNFEAWILKHRTIANELFYDLKRLAVIKKWSRERFFRDAKELMDLKGHFFGDFEHSAYESVMQGVEIKDAVYPWSVILKDAVAKTKGVEGTEETGEDDKRDEHPFRLVTTTCDTCGEDGSRPAWGQPIGFTWNGADAIDKYFTCPKPGCTTAWNEYVREGVLQNQDGEEILIHCKQCLSDICADCGAIKPTTSQKYWRQIATALDITAAPGSTPFRKAAHQKGFKERSLTDVYAPLDVDDFLFHGHDHHLLQEKAAEGTNDEASEAAQKKCDLKRLFEMRADRSVGNADPEEPRGRQIARIDFAPMHDSNPTDRWFSLRNRELYEETARFCGRWFGDVDFPADYHGAAWLEDYGEQFLQYTNLAAAEDGLRAPWDVMMKSGRHRRWLVMGILSQIMEKKIHSELLFGASEAENLELDKQDAMFLAADGFPRTKLRSYMINMFLGDNAVSTMFWPTVDHLTNSTMTILLPLTNLLCYFRPSDRWTDTFEMYSQLHSLIAQVGYFAICMQRDASIFHASYDLYRECKEEAEARDKVWTEAQQAIIKKAQADATKAAGAGPEAEKHVAELEKEFRVNRHHRLRGARVKYAVWPMVTRYRPENEGWTLPGGGSLESRQHGPGVTDEDIEKAEGQRILEIGKCVVIYSQGLMYPRPNHAQAPLLRGPGGAMIHGAERDGETLFDYRAAAGKAARDAAKSWKVRGPRFAAMLAFIAVLLAYRVLIYAEVREYVPAEDAEPWMLWLQVWKFYWLGVFLVLASTLVMHVVGTLAYPDSRLFLRQRAATVVRTVLGTMVVMAGLMLSRGYGTVAYTWLGAALPASFGLGDDSAGLWDGFLWRPWS
ncbi:uncharacterized protein PG998_007255 [Apiospora kogelbergensis]|uniref:uncharacterized protein n=1 Tax=Apiospora kogelbergensis TaxID=1337665 RepID=UPI00312E3163